MSLYSHAQAVEAHFPILLRVDGNLTDAPVTSTSYIVPNYDRKGRQRRRRVRAWVGTAATGTGGVTVDVLVNGQVVSTVDLGTTAANTPVDGSAKFFLKDNDVVTLDVTSVGGTTPGANLHVQILAA